jgi:hypothetical protein
VGVTGRATRILARKRAAGTHYGCGQQQRPVGVGVVRTRRPNRQSTAAPTYPKAPFFMMWALRLMPTSNSQSFNP